MRTDLRMTIRGLLCGLLLFAVTSTGCAGPGDQVHSGPPWASPNQCANDDCPWHGTKAAVKCAPKKVAMAPKPAPKPVAKPKPMAPAPAPAPGIVCGRLVWPTGNQSTSSILVEKCAPGVVQVGIPFDFNIKVTNLTNTTLKNVIVTDEIPASYSISKISPQATSAGGTNIWKLGDMAPRSTKTIVLSGTPTKPGKLQNCITVTHQLDTCVAVDVVAPKLVLTKTAPASALACDTIPIKFTVSNSGVGAARQVKIVDNLPSGMVTEQGKSSIEIPVGTLAAGKSMTYTVNTKVSKSGTYTNKATATGLGNLSANATSVTNVTAPNLKITKTGPAMRFVGRPIEYTVVVTNTGNGEARNTIVEDAVPAGTRWVSASDGGNLVGNKIVWNLGTLAPNASRRMSVKLTGSQIGKVTNTATAKAYCANPVSASASTDVKGIPAILLECVDIEDPVEVGNICTYVITVTNQGSLTGTGIAINVELEDSMEYSTSSGPTTATARGQTITFAPLASLAPKAKTSWTVKVKAVKSGDVRFKITLNSDQISRPVIETESTHFYE